MWKAVQAVQNKKLQAKLLADLASHIPQSFLYQFWAAVHTIEDIGIRTRILTELVSHLPQEGWAEVLEMRLELPCEEQQLDLLEAVIPHLSQERYIELLEAIIPLQSEEQLADVLTQTTWEKRWQRRTLAVLVPHLPEARRLIIIPALLKATQKLRIEEDQVWLLTKLTPHVLQEFLDVMLDAIWSMAVSRSQVQVWEGLLPSLSQTGWAKVLDLVIA